MANPNDYVVDFSDVEERDFTPIPRGRYVVEIVGAEINDGTSYPYLGMEYQVMEGDFAERKLWDNMSFSPKALWKLKGFYRAMGATDDEMAAGEFNVEPDDLIGQEIMIQVAVKADQDGEPRNVCSKYMAVAEQITA